MLTAGDKRLSFSMSDDILPPSFSYILQQIVIYPYMIYAGM